MKLVADKLSAIAREERDNLQIDSFGRSAFNRYYYSSFLIVRDMLVHIRPEWIRSGHKGIPDVLEGQLRTLIRNEAKKQVKIGLMTHGEAEKLKSDSFESISHLSSMLREAYYIRVLADYEPDCTVIKKKNVLYLGEHTDTGAAHWPDKTNRFKGVILNACRKLGICSS